MLSLFLKDAGRDKHFIGKIKLLSCYNIEDKLKHLIFKKKTLGRVMSCIAFVVTQVVRYL